MTEKIKTDSILARTHKDSVFRMIFGKPEKMIELYNAIFDTNYPLDTKIDINTIEEVFHRVQKNDISFTIDGTYIMVTEHQSTINPNMPLRDIIYILEIWKGMFETNQLYKRKRIKLPQPKFIVLYNGTEPLPPVSEIKLSESFLGDTKNPLLNLTVLVYNVNEGIGCDLLAKSPTLYQYSQLISLIRSFQARGPVTEQDMGEIVKMCLKKGILVDFMKEHGKRLIDFLHFELTEEENLAFEREDGYEEGLEHGLSQGHAMGLAEGVADATERLNKLTTMLISSGRIDDLKKAAEDTVFQRQLLEEFGL
ncbi:MAG: hypothetical protein IJB73_01165 [Firmicutes bacterium]|nr:hypothetical protein [Bacillota bacterium]